jgi:hypothetical protein
MESDPGKTVIDSEKSFIALACFLYYLAELENRFIKRLDFLGPGKLNRYSYPFDLGH